ncbi:DUF3037 domain-containing protein [Pokkaliibacter sp. MBI-7]|uniref:DUF3037 domain-containing protein n=1 Tax=Pokkaliibacter sp. MBI-7 TaxID=3040600 RepID=UPI0024499A49|nr:DUF3037 domain-containing protein [Pokkaliibacter sp. MBI-7]MDH2433428.1 DUF3037 domain-containing protein [Pokkaliibacter sp. MBI-7]
MIKLACQYKIVRFQPYAETEEFANVGVVLFCPATGDICFRLASRLSRVTDFFSEMDRTFFAATLKAAQAELNRLSALISSKSPCERQQLFDYLTEEKEALVRFSDVRLVMAKDIRQKLDELFGHYVQRDFVNRKYREEEMNTKLRQCFRQLEGARKFSKSTVSDGFVEVSIPFVHRTRNDHIEAAIKPLAFDQQSLTKVVEHGDQWLNRAERVIKAHAIDPTRWLFAVEPPRLMKTDQDKKYYGIFINKLKGLGLAVTDFANEAEILRFATA